MITLHHLRIGRSIYTVWLLEELGIDYRLEVYHRNESMRAPESLKKIHPLGKSPVIEDNGIVVAESGAITMYLINKYDTQNKFGVPATDDAQAELLQWVAYPEGSVFGPLLMKMMVLRSGQDHPFISPHSDAEIQLHLNYIATKLADQNYILGERLTAADFGIAFVIGMAQSLEQLGNHPTLVAYIDRVKNRAAYKQAVNNAVE